MGNETNTEQLLQLADDLAMTPDQRFKMALAIGNLMFDSWQDGYYFAGDECFSCGWNAAMNYNNDLTWMINAPLKTQH